MPSNIAKELLSHLVLRGSCGMVCITGWPLKAAEPLQDGAEVLTQQQILRGLAHSGRAAEAEGESIERTQPPSHSCPRRLLSSEGMKA